ncbi:MAG: competence damage-inducible protein A [Rhodothalassiaceae bacterium]|nr:MAG: competence damage-inducible protein A [Rhodothalassiaceae bacterium]
MPCDARLVALAAEMLALARTRNVKIATAESCTGGLLAAVITEVPGASDVFERGFVTYSNAAKTELLGVPAPLILEFGAVSEEVAAAMATGALAHARADLAVSVTGIAGPGGGTPDKPVGTVCFGLARKGAMVRHWRARFAPDSREKIRENAVRFALERLIGALSPAGADG